MSILRLSLDEMQSVPLFEGLSAEQLRTLHDLLHRKTFSAGSSILVEEDAGDVAYIVLRGTVKIEVAGSDNSDVILAILGEGEVVGEMSLVDGIERSASVVALEEVVLAWIDRAAFWECLRTMPAMSFNLSRVLSRRVRLCNAQVQSLASLDVPGRVARQLLAFAREYGQITADGATSIPLRLTQNDIAGLVGASRARVNQTMVGWKRRKTIGVDESHRITIYNITVLQTRCR